MRATRCSSMLRSSDGRRFQCRLEAGHLSAHETRTPAGLTVVWDDTKPHPDIGAVPIKSDKALIGWRAWSLWDAEENGGWMLESLSVGQVWDSPRMTTKLAGEARGLKRVLPSAYGDITRWHDKGVYSYKTPTLMIEGLPGEYEVYGRVDNLGHVVEHELGYRAQIAVVRELWVLSIGGGILHAISAHHDHDLVDDVVKDLERRYDCPAHRLPVTQPPWSNTPSNLVAWAKWYEELQEKGELT